MAGIGEAASIIAVIQISTQVFSLCQGYILSVKDARKDAQRLTDSVLALHDVLEKIEHLGEDDPGSAKLTNVEILRKPGGQLEKCMECLSELCTKLNPGDGIRKLGFKLKWPFSSKEVEKFVGIIGGHKATFTLALTADLT
jgi:hypothetical protein